MTTTLFQPTTAHVTTSKPPQNTSFWIVCCEDSEVTQQITQAVAQWQLPGVRSLIAHDLPQTMVDTVSPSDYAIFISPYEQPCSQIRVSPLSASQKDRQKNDCLDQDEVSQEDAEAMPDAPTALLRNIQNRHGHFPQAWWFQLPTTEVRAQRVQPVSTQKSVAQALNQIEIFVRNYRLAIAATPAASQSSQTAAPAQNASANAQAGSSEDKSVGSSSGGSAAENQGASKQPSTKKAKREVVLSHYRRI